MAWRSLLCTGVNVRYNVEENFTRYMRDIGSNILFSPVPGKTIKGVRKAIEASQEAVAGLLGVRRETVSRIETGGITPTAAFIRSFSKAASIIKVFRDINALKDTKPKDKNVLLNPTFIRTHFSLSPGEFDAMMRMGDASYSKTKKKILRRIRI